MSFEREGLQTSNLVHRRSTKTRISDKRSDLQGQGRKVTWCIWQVLADKSRTNRPRKTKIGRKIVHAVSNNAPQIQGQRSRSPYRLMLRPEVRHIFWMGRPTNFKLVTQMEQEDLHQQQAPWPPRSKVKVAMSRDASDRCWLIIRERNILETPKLVGILSTPRAIMRTSFKVKGQGHQGGIMLRPEVRYIFRTERPTNFKLGV